MHVSVEVRCPACNKSGQIKVDKNIFDLNLRGITAVNVSKGFICKHSFVIYIDTNLAMRDAFVCDFKIESPDFDLSKDVPKSVTERTYDLDLVKINLTPSLLANTLTGIYHKKKILMLSDQEFLNIAFFQFFKSIIYDTFDLNLNIISKNDYKANKKEYKDFLILSGKEVINDKNKIINPKKMLMVNMITQKFYADRDSESSLIIIKNENQKTFILAKAITNFFKEDSGDLDIKNLKKYLNTNIQNIEISPYYMSFLFDIVENYFEIKVPYSMKITLKMLF